MRPSEVAERALLGALLLEPARRMEVEAWLEPSDFYAYRHALVYTTIQRLHDEAVEPTARAVLNRILPDAESRRNVDGPYLHTLMEACPHPSRAAIYGRMVLEASIHRRTADRAARLGYVAQADAPADVVFEQLGEETQQWLSELDALAQRWADAGGEPATGVADHPIAESAPNRVGQAADEVALVASLVAAPWQYPQIHTWLTPEDFTRDDIRTLFNAVCILHHQRQPVDDVTVLWAAVRSNEAGAPIDAQTVTRLREAGIPGYAVVAARQVLHASLLRSAFDSAAKVRAAARLPTVPPSELISTSMREIESVQAAQSRLRVRRTCC